jgi:hypothetical protein
VPGGSTVRLADRVTPPPDTKTVTTVGTDTVDGMSWTLARVLNAGTTVLLERDGRTAELLLLTFSVRSKDTAESTATVPLGVPVPPPTTSLGTMVNEMGTTWGVDDD